MTPEEKKQLLAMCVGASDRYNSDYSNRIEEIGAIQAYTSCLIVLQLDRIATALEDQDAEIPTSLHSIVGSLDGLSEALLRQK